MSEQTFNLETTNRLSQEQRELAYAQRDEALKALLDPSPNGEPMDHHPNYEFAKDSGLLDIFYFDPETGEDGLRHILEGDVRHGENGAREVAGYHHEPSAQGPDTFVDYEALSKKNSRGMRDYKRFPFSPYNAPVVIKGYAKSVLQRREDGSFEEITSKSSMFPEEYDALAVMQAARIALETRDTRNDEKADKNLIVSEGFAPMLDGEHHMKLKLWLDADTGQLVTAFPIVKRSTSPSLTKEEINQHLGL